MKTIMLKVNYIENNMSVWCFPGDAGNNEFFRTIPEVVKYVIVKDDFMDIKFMAAHIGDFSLENGAESPMLIDIERAKEVFINYMRRKRTILFSELDVQYMKALENQIPEELTKIVETKKALRDVTKIDLSSATDLETLKSLWPTDILGKSPFENE